MIEVLSAKVADPKTPELDGGLLFQLLATGLDCPGFNYRQKFDFLLAAGDPGAIIDSTPSIRFWPFDTLVCKSDVEEAHVLVRVVAIALFLMLTFPGVYGDAFTRRS